MPTGDYDRSIAKGSRQKILPSKAKTIENWREKINTTNLLIRLNDHALGKLKMLPTQIKAAQIILNKVVPDLNRTELSGPEQGPIEINNNVDPSEAYMAMLKGSKAK